MPHFMENTRDSWWQSGSKVLPLNLYNDLSTAWIIPVLPWVFFPSTHIWCEGSSSRSRIRRLLGWETALHCNEDSLPSHGGPCVRCRPWQGPLLTGLLGVGTPSNRHTSLSWGKPQSFCPFVSSTNPVETSSSFRTQDRMGTGRNFRIESGESWFLLASG